MAHAVTDQSSILRFIEDNWRLGRIGGGLVLDPSTGKVVSGDHGDGDDD